MVPPSVYYGAFIGNSKKKERPGEKYLCFFGGIGSDLKMCTVAMQV
jgi:hypothetical protein